MNTGHDVNKFDAFSVILNVPAVLTEARTNADVFRDADYYHTNTRMLTTCNGLQVILLFIYSLALALACNRLLRSFL